MLFKHGFDPAPLGGVIGVTYAAWPPAPPPPVVVPAPRSRSSRRRRVETVVPDSGPPPPPRPSPRQTSDEIFFDGKSARLTNIAKAVLDGVALRMKNDLNATAIVTGYTDNTGNESSEDMELGAETRRSREGIPRDAARIDPGRITAESRGASEPRLRQRLGRGQGEEPPRPDRRHPRLGNVIAEDLRTRLYRKPPPREGVF